VQGAYQPDSPHVGSRMIVGKAIGGKTGAIITESPGGAPGAPEGTGEPESILAEQAARETPVGVTRFLA